MKKIILVWLAGLLLPALTFAQKPCAFYELYEKMQNQDPALLQKQAELEKFTQKFKTTYFKRLFEKQSASDTALYIIPVVFHVMHDCGPENISKDQIVDAIRVMNLDFQARHPDTSAVIPLFKPIVGNCRVEFRLATKDPQGKCTEGITRHQTPLTNGGDEILKAIVQWPPNRYLNIWVENYITLGGAAAYSSLPGMSPASDGIVASHNYVGSVGTSSLGNSHVLSHEAGHFLNLQHTWGLSSGPGLSQNCTIDDGVTDTPNTIGSNFACDVAQSVCAPGVIENVQNIMDYSSCLIMFTEGQVARMQAALHSSLSNRNNLWTNANLLVTGTEPGHIPMLCKPIAMLCSKPIRVCTGQPVTFENQTFGALVSGYQWSLPGSSEPNSTAFNPTVTYTLPGEYDAELTATNGQGSTTISLVGLVQVVSAVGSQTPVMQSFEENSFPYPFWVSESETGNDWEVSSDAFATGLHSLLHWSEEANMGKKATFYTEPYDFSSATNPYCRFKLAFSQKNGSADVLKVYMSVDCGQNWSLRYSKAGSSLATAVDTSSNFIPTSTQWREEGFNMSPAIGKPNVRFRFELTYKGGQNLYLDDFSMGNIVEILPYISADINVNIFPNPAHNQVFIETNSTVVSSEAIQLFAEDGRLVETKILIETRENKNCITISPPPISGVYFLHIGNNERRSVHKICFE